MASLRAALTAVVRNMSWTSPLVAATVGRWITAGEADRILAWQETELEARRTLTAQVLAEFSPRLRPGGFYAWLELPAGVR